MNARRFIHCAALLGLAILAATACAVQGVIFEKASPYGDVIVTEDASGLRTLLFNAYGARQSVVKPGDPDHLELPYARVALVGLAVCGEPRRILIVGLGGGTLPMILHKHYPGAVIDVAEINPDVVEVAKKFFDFREDEHLKVSVGDGRRFIENVSKPTYDLIVLDAFGGESVPQSLTTREFLQAVRKAILPSGVVVGNVWNRSGNPQYDSMVRTYQEVFDDLYILDVSGTINRILLALPRKQNIERAELQQRAGSISKAGQFRYDLGDPQAYGFFHAVAKNPEARVLRDADNARRK
jgi:spermidine synthase